MQAYEAAELEGHVQTALGEVAKVLHQNRSPKLPGDVHHSYVDKYHLVEFMANGSVAAALGALEKLGLTEELRATLVEWSAERTVTLELRSTETCAFKKKVTREVDSHGVTTEAKGISSIFKRIAKLVTTVEEWLWDFEVQWELCAVSGTARDEPTVLRKGGGHQTVKTLNSDAPYVKHKVRDPLECDLTWLLQRLGTGDGTEGSFSVDRTHAECHTPRRNKDVDSAVEFFEALANWGSGISDYFEVHVFGVGEDTYQTLDMDALSLDEDTFVPVLPLMESTAGSDDVPRVTASPDATTTLPPSDLAGFVAESLRQLDARCTTVEGTFPACGAISTESGVVSLLSSYLDLVGRAFATRVNYVEWLLRQQLVAAIGKEVTSSDFNTYMEYHARNLFKTEYAPKGFCHAVRRPDHHPEGLVSIVSVTDTTTHIPTVSRCVNASDVSSDAMRFRLNAAAEVTFTGPKHIHSHIAHRFSTEPVGNVFLDCRARQFSGFIVLLGTIGGKDVFLPKHAIIVQNKDEYRIPLKLAEIPTAKEFQDSISSLSPEQQRFAKAYRGMQMEATLFGVCVVQIKPQLERVLNLPPDALTKELELTQDLLEIFIKYQVSPDLLAFTADLEDPAEIPTHVKVDAVRKCVGEMKDMVKRAKEEELGELERANKMLDAVQEKVDQRLGEVNTCILKGNMEIHHAKMYQKSAKSRVGGLFSMIGAMLPSRDNGDDDKWNKCFDYAPDTECTVADDGDFVSEPVSGKKPAKPDKSGAKPSDSDEISSAVPTDLSAFPTLLEQRLLSHNADACLRPTIISVGDTWTKSCQKGLLSKPRSLTLSATEQKTSRDQAFDLLDALTRSGALSIDCAELHVVVVSTHCFDTTLMDTVVQKSVNPIEKIEASMLIAASAVHDTAPVCLMAPAQMERVSLHSYPQLYL